jgi:hypothetical protein
LFVRLKCNPPRAKGGQRAEGLVFWLKNWFADQRNRYE